MKQGTAQLWVQHKVGDAGHSPAMKTAMVNEARNSLAMSTAQRWLKVHKREKFFGSDFEFFTIL